MSSQPISHSFAGQFQRQTKRDSGRNSEYFQPEVFQTSEEKAEESRRIDHLQAVLGRVMRVIQQDRSLPVERASELVANARRAALAMFPDKAVAFDLLWWPRLQRTMRERYRMQ